MLLVGVDIGTSSTKGVLVDKSGQIIASHTVPHAVARPNPAWAEQDADQVWWGDFVEIARALMSQAPAGSKVASIGVSGTCPTLVPVGHDGRPLRRGILYSIDRRALAEIDEIVSDVGEHEIVARSGNVLSTQCIAPKLLWLKRHEPEVYENTQWVLGTTSYVVWRLTGEACWDHFCAGDGGYGYQLSDCRWDIDALNRMGIDPSILPPLRWATDVVGTIHSEAARETGLPEGTPVIAGTGDAAAEMVGTGVIDEGSLALLYGSTLATMSPVSKMWVHPGFILTPGLLPGSYLVSSVLGTGSALIEWIRGVLAWDGSTPDHATLEGEAIRAPAGSDGLVFIPYLTGQRSPEVRPDMSGALLGLNQGHSLGHVYRAALEGVAFALRSSLAELSREGLLNKYEIRAAGGGSQSELWTQIVTDVCRHAQRLTSGSVRAPIGSAFLAGRAVGIVDARDLRERWVGFRSIVSVREDYANAYDHHYDRFMRYVSLLAGNAQTPKQ
ncbi:MAG: FGGY family carbohydrate kinase [Clostridia bacterium]|nr:FGGY family carbohydrate kinase [Clostridia bacterium]